MTSRLPDPPGKIPHQETVGLTVDDIEALVALRELAERPESKIDQETLLGMCQGLQELPDQFVDLYGYRVSITVEHHGPDGWQKHISVTHGGHSISTGVLAMLAKAAGFKIAGGLEPHRHSVSIQGKEGFSFSIHLLEAIG